MSNAAINSAEDSGRVGDNEAIKFCDLKTGVADEPVNLPVQISPAAHDSGNRVETILVS